MGKAPANRSDDCSTINDGGILRWKDAPLVRELFVMHNMMMRCGDRLVADLGLTSSRWILLGAVTDYDEPPTLTTLSNDALLSVQNVSRMVAAMENDGLLERFSKPGEGRSVFVGASPKGEEICEIACGRGEQFTREFLSGFSEEEIRTMQGFLDRMLGNLQEFERLLQSGALPEDARDQSEQSGEVSENANTHRSQRQ